MFLEWQLFKSESSAWSSLAPSWVGNRKAVTAHLDTNMLEFQSG